MKVLLLSGNIACTPYPAYPIGLSVVAQSLLNKGYAIRFMDFLQSGSSVEKLTNEINAFQPDAIGISIRNIDNVNLVSEQRYIDGIRAIVQAIKGCTSAPVILGGSGYSLMPERILEHVGADYGIRGEGEEAFHHLLQTLQRGEQPPRRIIDAVATLDRDGILPAFYDPDILPFYIDKGRFVPMQTKRGCARKCSYCTYPILEGSTIRARRPAAVVDDIERLQQQGNAPFLFFVDSLFNDIKGNYRELVREMHTRKIKVPWTAFFGPSRELDDEIVLMMKETGLRSAEVGADAASDATLRGIRKGFTFDDVRAGNELFMRHGVSTAHYYMFGGPGETPETIEEGIHNILSLRKTVNFIFLGIRIIPGTELMHQAINDGVLDANADLLEPAYYVAPGLDVRAVEHRLTEAFEAIPHCVFPPDKLDTKLQILYRLGYDLTASYDLLLRE